MVMRFGPEPSTRSGNEINEVIKVFSVSVIGNGNRFAGDGYVRPLRGRAPLVSGWINIAKNKDCFVVARVPF